MDGLSKEEVKKRQDLNLINRSKNTPYISYFDILRKYVFTFFNLINVILFILILISKKYGNGLFMGTVILNSCIGIFNEIRSKRSLEKLNFINRQKARVLRDKIEQEINVEDLVMDDILILKEGSQPSVDSILVKGSLEVDESFLSGESDSVYKEEGQEIYSGSLVVGGLAFSKVISINDDTYTNKLLNKIRVYKPLKSKLIESINKILKIVAIIIVPLGFALFFVQEGILADRLIRVVAALVGMIPEGLFFLTSLALAIGSYKLSKKEVLLQQEATIEMLARVDTICFDKTGTLTRADLRVTDFISYIPSFREVIGNFNGHFKEENPTSLALKNHFETLYTLDIISSTKFSSKKKYSSITLKDATYYLGAYENLFTHENTLINAYKEEGKRILVLARKVKNMELAGIIVMEDTLRDTALDLIKFFKQEDIEVKIISGDDFKTVRGLANKMNLDNKLAINCSVSDLNTCDIENTNIFGRVTPDDKALIVKKLQEKDHIVAMVGDGINDVLALRQADVSITLFKSSEGVKNISNIILMNNDFSNVTTCIFEGRRIINNISRASSIFLIKTFFSALLTFFSVIFNFNYPFIPLYLTLISSLCVGIPTFLCHLEISTKKISKNFLKEAILKALPYSLSITCLVSLITILGVYNKEVATYGLSFTVIATSFMYLLALLDIYRPLTRYKLIVIMVCQGLLYGLIYLFNFRLSILFAPFYTYILLFVVGLLLKLLFEKCLIKLFNIL